MNSNTEYWRNLPHFQHIGASFFITFRLYDSLPHSIIQTLQNEREEQFLQLKTRKLAYEDEVVAMTSIKREYWKKVDDALDKIQTGPHYLKDEKIASLIIKKLRQYDNTLYYLDAYCIMSNHIHVLLDFSVQLPANFMDFNEQNYVQLHQVMKLIKGGTAYEANKILNRKGKFWEDESFDTYIRNDKHRTNVIHYILNNPVKIGICKFWDEYPFAWAR
jgi:putative transposase